MMMAVSVTSVVNRGALPVGWAGEQKQKRGLLKWTLLGGHYYSIVSPQEKRLRTCSEGIRDSFAERVPLLWVQSDSVLCIRLKVAELVLRLLSRDPQLFGAGVADADEKTITCDLSSGDRPDDQSAVVSDISEAQVGRGIRLWGRRMLNWCLHRQCN